MAGIQKVYDDIVSVYNSEINKPIFKKAGTIIITPPEITKRIKHTYTGIAKIQDDKIVQVYPSIDNIEKEIRKKVQKSCTNKLNIEINGCVYKYVKDI